MIRTTRHSAPVWMLALIVALVAARADALTISMDPAASIVGLGGSVDIALNVSGLGDLSAPSLGVYDIDVAWDASVVQLDAVSFGDPLLGNQLDLSSFGTIASVGLGAGTVSLFELSLDAPSTLDSLQAGSFTIATLTFQLIDVAATNITPTVVQVGDAFGRPLQIESVTGAVVSAIPEPSAAVLWMAGLLAVRSRIRRGRR